MKFSTLPAQQRSLLAALANAGASYMLTDRLANVVGTDPQGAAHVLCAMRKLGLVYSMEKGNRAYAPWGITDVGMQLFANRPDHTLVYVTDEELAVLQAMHEAGETKVSRITKFAVVSNFQIDGTGTKKQALLAAEELSLRTGQPCTVIGLVAQVTPPEKPRAQITLL
jgi:hypothetical protein